MNLNKPEIINNNIETYHIVYSFDNTFIELKGVNVWGKSMEECLSIFRSNIKNANILYILNKTQQYDNNSI